MTKRIVGRCISVAGITPVLALVAALISAPVADASATPVITATTATRACASNDNGCSTTIATIPSGAQLQVICGRLSDYYVEDLANRALEGFVPETSVRYAPGGLEDCDTTAHPAIYAAANALGDVGQPVDPLLCLKFVVASWNGVGVADIPSFSTADPVNWWPTYYGKFGYAWDTGGPRLATPPRGALVFWYGTPKYPQYDSEDGHVAISLGNGWVVSTEQGSSGPNVHLVTIANVTQQAGGSGSGPGSGTEMGWVMPIPGYQIQP